MGGFGQGIVTIALAIVGLAILAVIVSNKANTSQVISSAGNAFSASISAATNPFSGASGGNLNFTNANL
jgi:ribosomal protein L18